LKSQTIHEGETFKPMMLRPKPVDQAKKSSSSVDSSWLSVRLSQLEHILTLKPSQDESTFPLPSENLICLALTEPNDKAKRDTLLYAYPGCSSADPEKANSRAQNDYSEHSSNEFAPSLIQLGGMFIT